MTFTLTRLKLQVMLQAESEKERSLQNKKLVDLIPKER
ncbi:hypothetical protein J2T15_003107 [Paenibacillus harenae]|uniref:Uncharacterized protein n=1 Tax=Paenibacillus harenae TaxID=306543 RepID=A0ABT9U5Z8_PAEHA|nr:hypothetical protein [Paenibacillus harenae]